MKEEIYIVTKTDSRNRKLENPISVKEITVIVWNLKFRSPVNSYLNKQIL